MNKQEILENCTGIIVPENIVPEYERAYQIYQYTHDFILETLRDRVNSPARTVEEINLDMQVILDRFYNEVLPDLISIRDNDISESKRLKNIFTLSNTQSLSKSSDYTRLISQKLGHKLEEISFLSSNVFSLENEFDGLKLSGVDIVFLRDNSLFYTQLKTKKDTLSGSNAPRSRSELSTYLNSIFAAALPLGKWSFTPGDTSISRVCGADFWNQIGIDYSTLEQKIILKIRALETELLS